MPKGKYKTKMKMNPSKVKTAVNGGNKSSKKINKALGK